MTRPDVTPARARPTRRVLLIAALLACGAGARRAHATVLLHADAAALARTSDVVAHARVTALAARRERIGEAQGIFTRVALEVIDGVVGAAPGERLELVVHGGRVGDEVRVVAGQAAFEPGEEVVVFLYRAAGVLWPNGMAQGKWRVVRDAGGRAWCASVLPAGLELVAWRDGRLVPAPREAPAVVALDALRARVLAARRGGGAAR